jgi:hypothetical protein
MSSSKSKFLAVMPFLALLSMAPGQIENKYNNRTIASVKEAQSSDKFPKFEARASKIDRSKISIDADLDLSCFSEREEAFRKRLLEQRKTYQVDLVEKEAVSLQKSRVQSLVQELVELEEDFKALQAKKAWSVDGEEIAKNTVKELKTTLESLLIDEVENESLVLKEETKNKEVVKDKSEKDTKADPKDENKSDQDQKICDLEEKNKVLTKQVDDLLAEQKKILETMMGMNTMMTQMHQQAQPGQQQYAIPAWLFSGSLVNPYLQYPYHSSPTIIMLGNQGPVMGQNAFEQGIPSGQFQFNSPYQYQALPQPYEQSWQMAPIEPSPYNVSPGQFGQSPLMSPYSFNFS